MTLWEQGQMRFVCAAQAKWVMDLLPKINTVDIGRLCGGKIRVVKKGEDLGKADMRAAEAAKVICLEIYKPRAFSRNLYGMM